MESDGYDDMLTPGDVLAIEHNLPAVARDSGGEWFKRLRLEWNDLRGTGPSSPEAAEAAELIAYLLKPVGSTVRADGTTFTVRHVSAQPNSKLPSGTIPMLFWAGDRSWLPATWPTLANSVTISDTEYRAPAVNSRNGSAVRSGFRPDGSAMIAYNGETLRYAQRRAHIAMRDVVRIAIARNMGELQACHDVLATAPWPAIRDQAARVSVAAPAITATTSARDIRVILTRWRELEFTAASKAITDACTPLAREIHRTFTGSAVYSEARKGGYNLEAVNVNYRTARGAVTHRQATLLTLNGRLLELPAPRIADDPSGGLTRLGTWEITRDDASTLIRDAATLLRLGPPSVANPRSL